MAQTEEDIIAAGAEIIWVLEQSPNTSPGTAVSCRDFVDSRGSDKGLCVGDSETLPSAGTFDGSGFSTGRGFDAIVRRKDMVVVFASDHGTPAGNDNLSGQQILAEVQAAVAAAAD